MAKLQLVDDFLNSSQTLSRTNPTTLLEVHGCRTLLSPASEMQQNSNGKLKSSQLDLSLPRLQVSWQHCTLPLLDSATVMVIKARSYSSFSSLKVVLSLTNSHKRRIEEITRFLIWKLTLFQCKILSRSVWSSTAVEEALMREILKSSEINKKDTSVHSPKHIG